MNLAYAISELMLGIVCSRPAHRFHRLHRLYISISSSIKFYDDVKCI